MKTPLFYFVICLIVLSCKDNKPKLEFKYSDKEPVIMCDLTDKILFEEALHNFESILSENYASNNPNLMNAYRQFMKEAIRNRIDHNSLATQHSLDIFEALKNVDGLWLINNNISRLNYDHEVFECIANNISDKDLKTTFNALLSTNSMSFRMLKDALMTKSSRLNSDKYLALYVALELFYIELEDVDLSKKSEAQVENKKNDSKIDPHAGHNHD